jgi:uncharacterized membrane protein YkoI
MTATHCSSGLRTPALALVFLAVTLAFAWRGWSGNSALAQTSTADGMGVAAEAQQTPQSTAKASKITKDEAVQIALKAFPGQAKAVSPERKYGKNVYLVEVIPQATGVEIDVFVDIETGKIVSER